MIDEVLNKIESSIPENVKFNLKRRYATAAPSIIELSNQLKQMSENNYEIRSILFKNNDDALYFSGDILAKTLYDFWIKGGSVYESFIENAKIISFINRLKPLWD